MTTQTGTTNNDILTFTATDTSIDGLAGTDTLRFNTTNASLATTTVKNVEILKANLASNTTFTLDQADLVSGGSVQGSTGTDTIVANGSALDLSSTTLTSIEVLKAGKSTATTFTVDAADLAANGSVIGSSGNDTLVVKDAAIDLTSTTLTSVEILKAGKSVATTFTVDVGDLVSGGSVIGSSSSDTLIVKGTAFDLSSTVLTSIEKLQADSTDAVTFTVNQADLASGGSVVGVTGKDDTLIAKDTQLNLSSTSVSDVEILKAGNVGATTFTVDQGDLASGGTVQGSTGADTLAAAGSSLDLTSTTLSSVEILKAGKAVATTFTVDAADLASGGSVVGSSGVDTLVVKDTAFNLSSTTLTSIEVLKAGSASDTTFTVNKADLASGGSVIGGAGSDTLRAADSILDLTSTTLTSVEKLAAGPSATTFIVDQADLAANGSVSGTTGTDTLQINGTSLDLTSTSLNSVEVLKAGKATATTFTVDAADLVSGGSVVGSTASDTLIVKDTAFDLSSTALTSVEVLKAGLGAVTEFTVNQTDLLSGGSVIGSSLAGDTLIAADNQLNLASTTLTGVEILKAGLNTATTFTVDQADLASGGSVIGGAAKDTLVANATALNLMSTTLSSVEVLQAGKSVATTFIIDQADLVANGSVVGSSGNDTLQIAGTAFDLSSTAVSSIEILKAGASLGTTFTVDTADLASGGSVVGSTGTDTLVASSASLDLSSTALTSVEVLQAGTTNDTTMTVNQADLAANGSVLGSSGKDTLQIAGSVLDLSSTSLTSVEILKAGTTGATTFIVNQADLASSGSVVGGAANDTLQATETSLDLTSTALTSIEILKAGKSAGTTFTVNQADLAANGSVIGSTGTDTLTAGGTGLDLSSTTLTSVEVLKAGTGSGTTFTVNQADLLAGGSVIGGGSTDTLLTKDGQLNLTSTSLTSVEVLQAGTTNATTFTVDQADLVAGGSVIGSSGSDSLVVKSSVINLLSTTLDSIEAVKAGSSAATTFTLDKAQLVSGGGDVAAIVGSSGSDTLIVNGTDFDLTSVTLTSVEKLQSNDTNGTTFTVDQTDLVAGGSIVGTSLGTDTVVAAGNSIDLTSTTLTSIEGLQAGTTNNTTFIVTSAQLNGLDIQGGKGIDTIKIGSSTIDFTSTTLTSIEGVGAGLTTATTITVLDSQLSANGGDIKNVEGNAGVDTLVVKGSAFDLSATTVTGIEKLQAGSAGTVSTTFTLDQADLVNNGSVIGSSNAADTILAAGTQLDLTSTTLTGVEKLGAAQAGTTFTLDATDLKSFTGGIAGNGGTNTLVLAGTAYDLTSATISDIEVLKASSNLATTFTVDAADLAAGGSVIGGTGPDVLTVKGTAFDLSSTALTSIETLKTGTSQATTFTLDQNDLAANGSVVGSSGNDILLTHSTQVDLSSTTLTSIETLQGDNGSGTTFIVNQADLVAGGAVIGDADDAIVTVDSQLDLTSTTLTSVETLKAGTTQATTFRVDANDLVSGGSVVGNTNTDTLVVRASNVDLTSTDLTSVEIIKAGLSGSTTFKVDLDDLAANGSVIGSSGTDTLIIEGTDFNLSSTALTSIEKLQADDTNGVTFNLTQDDLAAGGSVIGSSGTDTIAASGSALDLTSTTLSNVENVTIAATGGAVLTVTSAQLAALNVAGGMSNADVLVVAGTDFNLTSTTLTDFEGLKAGSSFGTTFTLSADQQSGLSITGSTGTDALIIKSTAFDLTSTTLSSVEALKAGQSQGTAFTVDAGDLAAGGSVIGSSGSDSLTIVGTTDFNLTSTSLTSVENLVADSANTTFKVDQADLAAGGSVTGQNGGIDVLQINGNSLDLTSTTLNDIEVLKAGKAGATTFTVDQADLALGGSVIGGSSTDTLIIAGTSFDLTSTSLTSVETLTAGSSNATTFNVDGADLVGVTVNGVAGKSDTLIVVGTDFDVTSTTLSSVEILKAGSGSDTTFSVNQADLVAGGSIVGGVGTDTLQTTSSALDLTSTSLTSVEIVKGAGTAATVFTVDQADLAAGGSVEGVAGKNDTLAAAGTSLDLSSTDLTSIEILKAANTASTTFTVDVADLASGGSVIGSSSGTDTLIVNGTSFDLSSTALSSVEVLQTNDTGGVTFNLTQDDLASGGSVIGNTGNDTITVGASALDLTSTTLTDIENVTIAASSGAVLTVTAAQLTTINVTGGTSAADFLVVSGCDFNLAASTLTDFEGLKAGSASSTTFTLDYADVTALGANGSITGSSGTDTLTILGTDFDLTSTTLTSVEVLSAVNPSGVTFTLDKADITGGVTTIKGSNGTDTLVVKDTDINLTSTTLTSVETLKAGLNTATTFTLTQNEAKGVSIIGSSADDSLIVTGTSFNLTSATLTSVEHLVAGSTAATTFNLDQADLIAGGTVTGSTSAGDTLIIKGTSANLASTNLDGIEILRSSSSSATTFTVDGNDLASANAGGLSQIIGSTGSDTLVAAGTILDLTATTLTSVETLKAGTNSGTTFLVNKADLSSGGSVVGGTGTDILQAADSTGIDLSSTTLTSVEVLDISKAVGGTLKVDQADLASGGTVIGASGAETLSINGTSFDVSSTTLSSVEVLKAATTSATNFIVNYADLVAGGGSVSSIVGSTSSGDTVTAADTRIDLTQTTLSGIEKISAGTDNPTTIIVNQSVLDSLGTSGTITGGAQVDTLVTGEASLDLSKITLQNLEELKTTNASGTTFLVDPLDLALGGSVTGSTGTDIIKSTGTQLNLSNVTLTSIEQIATGSGLASTFTLSAGQQAGLTVTGSTSADTLTIVTTDFDLTSTTLSSVEILKATGAAAVTFKVDAADLASGGSVIGVSGKNDTLTISGTTSFDLTSTTLSSVESLVADTANVTFKVDAADLIAGGSVTALAGGTDVLQISGTALDLTSTTVTSVEVLKATKGTGTTFTVDQADLASGGSVVGSSGSDTLIVAGTSFDLTSTSLTSIENLTAGSTNGVTFSVDGADLVGVTVNGVSGKSDTLIIAGTDSDLTSTTLVSIEILKAASGAGTTFTADQADLASGGSVIGGAGSDTLLAAGAALDLTSTTLTSVETLKAGNTGATTFTVDQADLASGGSVIGVTGKNDTLVINGTSLDLSSTVLSSIETLKAASNAATTFAVNQADLASGGSIIGSTSSGDTVVAVDTQLDLTSTTLSGIEKIAAGTDNPTTITVTQSVLDSLGTGGTITGGADIDTLVTGEAILDLSKISLSNLEELKTTNAGGTTFVVDQADLAAGGLVTGSAGSDAIKATGTQLNLSNVTLTSIEQLTTGSTQATTFTLSAGQQVGVAITGGASNDTLIVGGTDFDLTSTTLSSVEILKASGSAAVTFKVDAADLAANGSVVGITGKNDTLTITGTTSFDLTATTLTSVESLVADTANVTFNVDQADLLANGSVTALAGGTDVLQINGTALDLTSTTVTDVEVLKAGKATSTTFTVDQADLAANGSVIGGAASDTLIVAGTSFDLTSTSLTSIEVLTAGSTNGATFTVDGVDLKGVTVNGAATKTDTLIVTGTDFDLTSTALSSVEVLKAGSASSTTFTVDQADLVAGGSVVGSTGSDTLLAAGTGLDLTSTTLTSVEVLQAGSGNATTFTVDQGDLAAGGSVTGVGGKTDTLVAAGTGLDLSSTTLTSIEVLKAGSAQATTFVVNQSDLANGGSIIGSAASGDTVTAATGQLDLTSTTLSGVEKIAAGTDSDTTITVNQSILDSLGTGGTITGGAGIDTLVTGETILDLSKITLSNMEELKTTNAGGTTFVVDQADLGSGGIVTGGVGTDIIKSTGTQLNLANVTLNGIEQVTTGTTQATTFTFSAGQQAGLTVTGSTNGDTVTILGTDFDLTSTTLSSVEILRAAGAAAVTFKVDAADLASNGSVIGISGKNDTLTISGTTSFDLTSTTLSSVEILAADTANVTFKVDAADLLSGGSVTAQAGGTDVLQINGAALDLTSTTLSDVEVLKAGTAGSTTFTVDQADLATAGSVIGSTSSDTLIIAGTSFDLTSTSLTSIEVLTAGSANAVTFSVDGADLKGVTVNGSAKSDTLIVAGTDFDLTSTVLSSVEILKAGTISDTTFTVDQADLASNGSVLGSSGSDTLIAAGTALDLTSTTLSSVEVLKAGSGGNTTFTVDQADLASNGSVIGIGGRTDTLVIAGANLDLSSTTLTSVEVLKAGSTQATTFLVNQSDLATGGSIVGSAASGDTVTTADTQLDLTSTTLSGIEKIGIGTDAGATVTVTQSVLDSLGTSGTIVGGAGVDLLVTAQSLLDLSKITLSNLEVLKTTNGSGTTFLVDQADLALSGTVAGGAGSDTIKSTGSQLNLSNVTLTSIENLVTGTTQATTFTLAGGQQVGTTITGSTSSDTLIITGTDFDLTSTTLVSIESLKATGTSAVTFTVDNADLASAGSVTGITGKDDTLVVASTDFNLTSTTLSSVEILKAGSANATTFTLDAADLLAGGSVIGVTGKDDILLVAGSTLDLTSTTVTNVEILKAGNTGATTFTVDQADLASGGSVIGVTGKTDTLIVSGTSFDLTSTSLTSIEVLTAGSTNGATFTVDGADLKGVTVNGVAGKTDTVIVAGTDFDLTSTTLSSIEVLKAGSTAATTFTVDAADLVSGGSVIGVTGKNDTLLINGAALDLTSTTISSVEILKAGTASATTFTVDQADLVSGGSIVGTGQTDILAAGGTSIDLSSTALSSIEVLKANTNSATTFLVNQADLASGGTIIGSTSTGDTVSAADTQLDLTSTTLTGIEQIVVGTASATTLTVDQSDLATGGSIIGGGALDTLVINGTVMDLSSTTVTAIEILQAGQVANTTFIVDQSDLAFGATVAGDATKINTLSAAGSGLNLTNVTLSNISILATVSTGGTTFTVDTTDLTVATTINGSAGNDTLTIAAAAFDTTSTTLSSVEILKATGAAAVTFTVDAADLASNGSVIGISGQDDTLTVHNTTDFNLASTTLTSVEHLLSDKASTTFTVDQADLASGGTVEGLAGGTDIVLAAGTSLDLTSTTLTDIEQIKAGSVSNTTFTIGHGQLGGIDLTLTDIKGNSGTDTLQLNSTDIDLTSTTLTSIEILKTTNAGATTFTVDAADLASNGSVIGSSGSDTLLVKGNTIDLSSTTLTSIEHITSTASATPATYTLGAHLGSASIDLGGNSGVDTLAFTSGYTLTDVSSQANILAHTVSVTGFTDGTGAGADVIDLSALDNGTGTYQDVQTVIDFFAPATLKDALDLVSHKDGSVNGSVVSFVYGGDTYIVVDNSASTSLTANDAVIKLVGTHTIDPTQIVL
jgi:hypothetical protein